MFSRSILLVTLALAGCGGENSGGGEVYIALQSDFADFQSWPRTFVGDEPLAGHPPGPRYGYVKQKPTATAYPVGSLVVKTVETGASPAEWDVFAMAKRGGGFNAGGALDWEFFTLKITADGVPVIFSRGTNPSDADGDGGGGSGYAPTADGVTCNACHGVAGTERSDHILSTILAPGAQ